MGTSVLENASPFIRDDLTNARAYFASILGMLVLESLTMMPSFLVRLLGNKSSLKKQTPHWTGRVLLHRIRTMPPLFPLLTTHRIPDLVRVVVFVGLNIIFGWNRMKFSGDFRRYGYLCVANGGLALLMSARTNFFTLFLRIPSPVLLYYHRFIGVSTAIHAILHFSLTADNFSRTGQLTTVLQSGYIQAGLVGLACLCIILITAASPVRRRLFEVFYYVHFLFFVFVIAAMIHAEPARQFLLPGLALWAVDRVIRFLYNFRAITIRAVTHYHGDVTKIQVEKLSLHRHAGQIAWVQIPSISLLNWHPFTIASAPGDSTATFAIRGLGGYTNKVKQLASGASSTRGTEASEQNIRGKTLDLSHVRLRIDGPYGIKPLQWEQYQVVALVAGGIGITPSISIISYLVKQAITRKHLSPANQTQQLHLLWVIRDQRYTAWFSEELQALQEAVMGLDAKLALHIDIFVTGYLVAEEDTIEGSQGHVYNGPGTIHVGRPNVKEWLDSRTSHADVDVAVNVCAPQSLVHDTRKAAVQLSRSVSLVTVYEEVFTF